MDDKHDVQKDNIKDQVSVNKNHTHDETRLGSQMGSVIRIVKKINKILEIR